MGTKIYSSWYKYMTVDTGYAQSRVWIDYTETNTNDTYKLTLSAGIEYQNTSTYTLSNISSAGTKFYISGTGQTTKSADIASVDIPKKSTKSVTYISSFTWQWTKGTSSASKTVTANDQYNTSYKATKAFTVPALATYSITYNANGGSGAPSSQTKYYGKSITLSSSKPTRSGYTFKGWATSATATTAAYQPGASYTGNAALKLYAVWDLNYVNPRISNVSIERCAANGTPDDEGLYASVSFNWWIDTAKYSTNTVASLKITVGTQSVTLTPSGSSGSLTQVIGNGAFNTDTQYDVTIVLTDQYKSVTATGVLGFAMFPLDISANGQAIAIGMPAPDNTRGVYIGLDMFLKLSDDDSDLITAISTLGWSDVLDD